MEPSISHAGKSGEGHGSLVVQLNIDTFPQCLSEETVDRLQ